MISRARASATVAALAVFLTSAVAAVAPPAFAAAPTVAPTTVSPAPDEVVSTTPVFAWQAVAGAVRYRFQASTSSAFPASSPTPLYDVVTYGLHATRPSALPVGQAYWHVAAMDATGNTGPFSPVVPFTVDLVSGPAPTAPMDGSTLTYPAQPPVLRWNPVAGVKSYTVDIDDTVDFTSPQTFTSIPTSQLALAEPPPLDIPQFWRVKGILDTGAGVTTSWSPTWSFTATWPEAPVATYPANGATVYQVRLAWNPVPGAKTYEVQVSPNGDFQNNLLALTGATSVFGTQYAPLVELQPQAYYWRVRAKDDAALAHLGPWSGVSTFTLGVVAAPTNLQPGADVAGTPPLISDPTFSWDPVARAQYYEIQIGTDQNFTAVGSYVTCRTDHRQWTAFLDGPKYKCNLHFGGARYFWRVRGVSSKPYFGDWSLPKSFYFGYPSTVTVTGPANGSTVETPALSWLPVTGFNKYRVQYRKSGAATMTTQDVFATSFTLPVDPATAGGLYYWTVQTLDADNTMGAVPLVESSFTLQAPQTPQATLAAIGPDGGSYVDMPAMSWTPLTGASSYAVYYRGVGAPAYLALKTGLKTTSYTSTAEPLGAGDFEWFVQALDSNGATLQVSAVLTFTVVEPGRVTYTGPTNCLTAPCSNNTDTPTLSWQPVPYAHKYIVHLATDANFANPLPDHVTQHTTITFPEQLPDNQAGQSYYWYVQVCKSASVCGPFQDGNLATYEASFRKATPGVVLLSPGPGATVGDDPHFAWQQYVDTDPTASPAKQYRLQVSSDSGFATLVDNVTLDQTTYTPFAKEYQDGTYYWRVQALDAENQLLTFSEPRTFVKSSAVPALDAVSTTTPLPTLTWEALGYVGGYRVEVYPGLTTNVTPAVAVTNKLPAWTPATSLDKGTYTWRVAKLDASGNRGPWSSTSTFDVALPAPALSSPADGAQLTTDDLLFSWSLASSSVAAYRFESSVASTFTTPFESQVVTGTSWAPAAKRYADGTTYYWRVSALDNSNHVLATSPAWSFVKDTVPPTVTAVTPTAEVPLAGPFTVAFSEPVQGVSSATLKVYPQGSPSLVVTGVVTPSADGRSATFKPSALLVPGGVYTVSLGSGITDAGGNALAAVTFNRRAATVVDSAVPAVTEFWDGDSSSYANGGTYATSRLAGATMTFTFSGTSTSLVATRTPLGGYGTVQLDARTPVTVSFYRSSTAYKQVVWSATGLTSGTHTVRVRVLGTRPSASSSTYVYVDAFTNGASVVQETSSAVRHGFSRSGTSSAYGGSYDRELVDPSGDTGGKPEYRMTFRGTGIDVYAVRGVACGRVRVLVDNVSKGDFDLYSSSTLYNSKVFGLTGLAAGTHTVRLLVIGTKNASSSGYLVQLDRFVVR